MNAMCPQCQSSRLVNGELRSTAAGHDTGMVAFHLHTTAGKFFWFSEPCVYPEETPTVCMDCGLLWTRVDLEEIRQLQEKHGKARTWE